MIIIIMIACCCVGALGPKAELILVCAAKLGIHEEKAEVVRHPYIQRRRLKRRQGGAAIDGPQRQRPLASGTLAHVDRCRFELMHEQRLPCALTNAPKPGDKTTMRYGLPASWWPGPATS